MPPLVGTPPIGASARFTELSTAAALAFIRRQSGLSQAEMGNVLCVSQPSVVRFERDGQRLSLTQFRQVCACADLNALSVMTAVDRSADHMGEILASIDRAKHHVPSVSAWRGLATFTFAVAWEGSA